MEVQALSALDRQLQRCGPANFNVIPRSTCLDCQCPNVLAFCLWAGALALITDVAFGYAWQSWWSSLYIVSSVAVDGEAQSGDDQYSRGLSWASPTGATSRVLRKNGA